MAKTAKRGKQKSIITSIVFFVAIIAVVLGRFNKDFETAEKPGVTAEAYTYSVHFIDVGQGSSTLLKSENSGILIDAGEREYGSRVVDYLKSNGIEKLDYVVATHPHTDHIGGLQAVLEAFPVDNIIMPKLSSENTPTTKTYESLLETIINKKIKVIPAKFGKEYTVGKITLEIFGPIEQSGDLNNMSVICKASVNSTTVLLSGDAEKKEMKSVMNKNPDLSCDVMLMGHHGSRSSLEKSYLRSADPGIGIISCGLDNSYGHPHEETIKYLENNNIKFFRTDKVGTIVLNCYDNGYKVSTEK